MNRYSNQSFTLLSYGVALVLGVMAVASLVGCERNSYQLGQIDPEKNKATGQATVGQSSVEYTQEPKKNTSGVEKK